jgi:hypothetical protein
VTGITGFGAVGCVAAARGEDGEHGGEFFRCRVAPDDSEDLDGRGFRGGCVLGRTLGGGHSGMFPCFLGGSVSRFVRSARRALMM